jgi:hypothetical protein
VKTTTIFRRSALGAAALMTGWTIGGWIVPADTALTCQTFEGPTTVTQCVPQVDPEGNEIADLYEDGSAQYQSQWTWDSDDQAFYLIPSKQEVWT